MRCLPPQRWPAAILLSALLGGVIAAGSHLAKSGGRALINTSPEPFSNWTASFSEDTLTLAGLWLALKYPLVFLTLLTVFILFALWAAKTVAWHQTSVCRNPEISRQPLESVT